MAKQQKLPHIPAATSTYARERLKELQAELNERRIEALRLYTPSPLQDRFHSCRASERLVIGGNRCLAGEQEIYDPVKKVSLPVSEIEGRFHVYSYHRGKLVVRRASRPFIKGYGELYEVTLSNGETIRTTLEHRLLTDGGWMSVADVWQRGLPLVPPQSSEEPSPSGCGAGGLRCTKKPEDSPACCRSGRRLCDEPLLPARVGGPASPRPPVCVRERTRSTMRADDRARRSAHTRTCLYSGRPSTQDDQTRGEARADAFEAPHACTPCSLPCPTHQEHALPALRSSPAPRTTLSAGSHPTGSACAVSPYAYSIGGNVRVYITAVEFLRQDAIWDITVPGTHNYLAAGVFSHNSGKTLCSAMEVARAATGQDPYKKYPEKDGVIAVVGRNWGHIGLVCVPYLLRAGALKIIRDKTTGAFRAFDPVADADRRAEAKPAPPLIPPRMIKSISWVLKSANYCNNIELHNGWRIFFFSSEGEAPQGFSADLVWLDEDLQNDGYVPEMQARLADRKGRLVFSAMPHSKSESLLGLSERADRLEEAGVENPDIVKFTLRFLDNAWIDGDEKRKMMERWAALGEDVLRMRAEGEFITDSVMVYPNFSMSVHGMDRADLPDGLVPQDWTRYAAVDPGHQVSAVVFAAVPPDGSMILLYDELYIRQCNATLFAEKFAESVKGQTFYQWIIDMHGGRIRDIGTGRQVVEQYMVALRQYGVRSLTTGAGFMAGCDDIEARTASVRTAMHIRPTGTPKLRILRGSCPNLERELKRYRKKVVFQNGLSIVTDTPNTKGECHAVQCMEYIIASEPKYHAIKKRDEDNQTPEWIMKYMERRSRNRTPGVVYLGPQSNMTSGDMEGISNDAASWM